MRAANSCRDGSLNRLSQPALSTGSLYRLSLPALYLLSERSMRAAKSAEASMRCPRATHLGGREPLQREPSERAVREPSERAVRESRQRALRERPQRET
jgi:hypothetical protein